MTTLRERLRRLAAGVVHSVRPYRGCVDGFTDGRIEGWVVPRVAAAGPVRVGAFGANGMLAQGVANIHRLDLERAGIGSGHHAFSIPLSPAAVTEAAASGGEVTVRVLGLPRFTVGRVRLSAGRQDAARSTAGGGAATPAGSLKDLLYPDLVALNDALAAAQRADDSQIVPIGHALCTAMMAPRAAMTGATLSPIETAYGDFVRYRYNLSGQFPAGTDQETAAHFLHWYVAGYSVLRRGLRVPLSAAQLAYLNAPVVIGGKTASLTQATWQFLLSVPPLVQAMDLNNADWVNWAIYWWAVNQAHLLNVEDCLVPDSYADRLARVPDDLAGQALAPSEFMRRMHAETPALRALDLGSEAGRLELAAAITTMAMRRPDYLRFIPQTVLDRVLDETGGENALSAFLRKMTGQAAPLSRAALGAALRTRRFDLDTRRFLTMTADGHRIEAALLPMAADLDPVDIQVIGPFEKASGLGQATRLSAEVLRTLGHDPNCVDFDLDNPAPEGFSRVGRLGHYRKARVNLIHLNAESIPLAFAYQPDVFSGAYNIGYFYWELDSPAACHYLAMDLLDEIWVSSDYGVRIFSRDGGCLVSNVGMCVEEIPEVEGVTERAAARAFVTRKLGLSGTEFLFLVAFDSFSFVQRKNPLGTLRAFMEAFPDDAGVRLVVKTQNRKKISDPAQQRIWDELDGLIAADRRIILMDETLSYDDLLRVKKGSDCYVSLHRSEGWGFGMLEAMNLRVPVICTGYSGNMEFCSDETAFLVGFKEVELTKDDYIFVLPGQKWAEPDVGDAARKMRLVRGNPELARARAESAFANVRANFSAPAIARRYGARVDAILGTSPRSQDIGAAR